MAPSGNRECNSAPTSRMPIEDPTVECPENERPYVSVARVIAMPQVAWSDSRSTAVGDGMSFSPWHALAAHRPIGSIMRVRKASYEMAAAFRSEHNHTKVRDPERMDSLPD